VRDLTVRQEILHICPKRRSRVFGSKGKRFRSGNERPQGSDTGAVHGTHRELLRGEGSAGVDLSQRAWQGCSITIPSQVREHRQAGRILRTGKTLTCIAGGKTGARRSITNPARRFGRFRPWLGHESFGSNPSTTWACGGRRDEFSQVQSE